MSGSVGNYLTIRQQNFNNNNNNNNIIKIIIVTVIIKPPPLDNARGYVCTIPSIFHSALVAGQLVESAWCICDGKCEKLGNMHIPRLLCIIPKNGRFYRRI